MSHQENGSGFIVSLLPLLSKGAQANASEKQLSQHLRLHSTCNALLGTAMEKKLLSHDQSPTAACDALLLQPQWVRNNGVWLRERGICISHCCGSTGACMRQESALSSAPCSAPQISQLKYQVNPLQRAGLKMINQASGLWSQLSSRVVFTIHESNSSQSVKSLARLSIISKDVCRTFRQEPISPRFINQKVSILSRNQWRQSISLQRVIIAFTLA